MPIVQGNGDAKSISMRYFMFPKQKMMKNYPNLNEWVGSNFTAGNWI